MQHTSLNGLHYNGITASYWLVQQSTMRLKFLLLWAPRNKQQHETGKIGEPKFTLCWCHHETTQHVMECPPDQAQLFREQALATLEDTLKHISTHPDLVTMLLVSMNLTAAHKEHLTPLVKICRFSSTYRIKPPGRCSDMDYYQQSGQKSSLRIYTIQTPT